MVTHHIVTLTEDKPWVGVEGNTLELRCGELSDSKLDFSDSKLDTRVKITLLINKRTHVDE